MQCVEESELKSYKEEELTGPGYGGEGQGVWRRFPGLCFEQLGEWWHLLLRLGHEGKVDFRRKMMDLF